METSGIVVCIFGKVLIDYAQQNVFIGIYMHSYKYGNAVDSLYKPIC